MKKITMGQIIHFGIIYLILAFFIFGSINDRSLLANLGFGFIYSLSWLSCFLIPSYIYSDPDFNQFSIKSNFYLQSLSFSLLFWLAQVVLVLFGLRFFQYNLMFINLMGTIICLFYALTIVVSKTPLTIKDNKADPFFIIIKAIISTLLISYFLYLGLIIIVINFTPKTETFLCQLSLIFLAIFILFITSQIPAKRLTKIILSCVIGFFITAIEIAYFSSLAQNTIINVQPIKATMPSPYTVYR
ncbi:hypothetical protein ACNVED_15420 (plasmid) [Legionella sp. D16C41]|uniref:hypothetical protein n=1 Tax=Legionella sp. D16C41 TaxID=3402688 RepID=UPI003AF8C4AD